MKNKFFVFCSDLHNHNVYGTFFELLYKIAQDRPAYEIFPIIICGDAYKENLIKTKKIITDILGHDKGIYSTHSNHLDNNNYKITKIKAKKISENITCIESLKKIEHSRINIGTSIASSIISKRRCISSDISDIQQDIYSYTYFAILFLESFKKQFHNYFNVKNDCILIYNGRHYNTGPIANFCESIGMRINYYERSGFRSEQVIQLPFKIHDFPNTSKFILNWHRNSNTGCIKNEDINSYFNMIKNNQFSNKLNNNCLISQNPIITYFSSSEDEYASIDERIQLSNLFGSQREAVKWLCQWATKQNKYTLVIRVHPNQSYVCQHDQYFWNNLDGKNIKLIPSQSNQSSYELIKMSEKVVSFLSTTGIEATYMGIPSIVLGNPAFSEHDVTYNPTDTKKLAALLETKLHPRPKENCAPYVNYQLNYGSKMIYFKKLGLASFSDYQYLFN